MSTLSLEAKAAGPGIKPKAEAFPPFRKSNGVLFTRDEHETARAIAEGIVRDVQQELGIVSVKRPAVKGGAVEGKEPKPKPKPETKEVKEVKEVKASKQPFPLAPAITALRSTASVR